MQPVDENFARKEVLGLVKTNIESTAQWVPPENVIEFIEKTYQFLVSGEAGKTDE